MLYKQGKQMNKDIRDSICIHTAYSTRDYNSREMKMDSLAHQVQNFSPSKPPKRRQLQLPSWWREAHVARVSDTLYIFSRAVLSFFPRHSVHPTSSGVIDFNRGWQLFPVSEHEPDEVSQFREYVPTTNDACGRALRGATVVEKKIYILKNPTRIWVK